MSHQVTLTKAIEKAIANGWTAPAQKFHVSDWTKHGQMLDNPGVGYGIYFDDGSPLLGRIYHPTDIIFNHDFAKALWGNQDINHKIVDNDGLVWQTSTMAWQYHLQQMVIADDPIKYLEENI